MSANPFGRLEYTDGRVMPGVWLASGNHGGRPEWRPYVWRDPSASFGRRSLARTIRAQVGDEVDVWDMKLPKPDPEGRKWPAYRLQGCGTPAAYKRHLRNSERPCGECTEANRLRQYARRAS